MELLVVIMYTTQRRLGVLGKRLDFMDTLQ